MLESQGGLEAAHRLLRPDAYFFSYGFEKPCSPGRPELTMEAMILDLDCADQLFSEAELKTALARDAHDVPVFWGSRKSTINTNGGARRETLQKLKGFRIPV